MRRCCVVKNDTASPAKFAGSQVYIYMDTARRAGVSDIVEDGMGSTTTMTDDDDQDAAGFHVIMRRRTGAERGSREPTVDDDVALATDVDNLPSGVPAEAAGLHDLAHAGLHVFLLDPVCPHQADQPPHGPLLHAGCATVGMRCRRRL